MPLAYRGLVVPVLRWLESLPTSILDARPSLWVTFASASMIDGQAMEQVEAKLAAAERALGALPTVESTLDLRERIAAIRATMAINTNDADTIYSQSRQALDHLAPGSIGMRTSALYTLGFAHQLRGEYKAARQAYTEVLPISEASGNTLITVAVVTSLGQIEELEGHSDRADALYRRVLMLASDLPVIAACEAHLGLARLAYARGDLETAEGYAETCARLASPIAHLETAVEVEVLRARLALARGDIDRAADILVHAEKRAHVNQFAGQILAIRTLATLIKSETAPTRAPHALRDPLTARELALLQLVAQGLSNRAIGDKLYLALDTVKGHNRRIFEKLGVQRRTEAVARARALGLL